MTEHCSGYRVSYRVSIYGLTGLRVGVIDSPHSPDLVDILTDYFSSQLDSKSLFYPFFISQNARKNELEICLAECTQGPALELHSVDHLR